MKHGRGWEGAAPEFDDCQCVGAVSEFFFFFFFSRIHIDLAQFAPNRADLARIKLYWPTAKID